MQLIDKLKENGAPDEMKLGTAMSLLRLFDF
jgi:hypothetical protein